jgi:hypothetical protein
MSSLNKDSFISSFPKYMPFISFYGLTALASPSNTLLNKNGEERHSFLAADLTGKAFSLSSLSMPAVGFFYMLTIS